MYIQLTNIDAQTGILCTEAPMRTGPVLPEVKGFQYSFAKESVYPIDTNADGTYAEMPLYYGTCDDDADTSLAGVVAILTEEQYNSEKEIEHLARRPYPSWIGDLASMSWQPPVPYPQDGNSYQWDEPTVSWIQLTEPSGF